MAFVEHGPTITICASETRLIIGDEFVLLYRPSLDILFGHNILPVLRRHLVWDTSSLLI